MLTYAEIKALEKGLRSTKVLSVFLEHAPRDPAARHGWRVSLDDAIRDVRRANTDASDEERLALERALFRFQRLLDGMDEPVRERAWVGYIGVTRIFLAQALPVATPMSVSWGTGIRVAPLIRAMKEARPAIVAVVDSRRADIYLYQGGILERLDSLHAHAHIEAVAHMGGAPQRGFHAGTRGRTGTDQAQRERLAGRRHLLSALADRMLELAGEDGWLVFGGAPMRALEAQAALPARSAARSCVASGLHLNATPPEIAAAAGASAQLLRNREDLEAVTRVVDDATAGGHGVLGLATCLAALEERRVSHLYVDAEFAERSRAEAERAIEAAFDGNATIEIVSDAGAQLLARSASRCCRCASVRL